MENFKRRLIISLSILGGGVLVSIVAIFLLNRYINTRVAKIEEIKNQIAQREQAIEVLTGSNTDTEEVKQGIKILEKALPSSETLINFPAEISQMAKSLALESGFEFGAETQSSSGPGSVGFNLYLAGQYKNIQLFLQELEQHRYAIVFDSIDLRQRAEKDGYAVNVRGSIFTAKSETAQSNNN